jgi:hypothetical protein
MVMIFPACWPFITRKAAWLQENVPRRSTLVILSQPAPSMSSMGMLCDIPALLTQTSIRTKR